MMRALVLEGAFGLPLGSWGFARNPLASAEAGIRAESPQRASELAALGWFDPQRVLLHDFLHAALRRFVGARDASEIFSEILLRPQTRRAPTRSYLHDVGRFLAAQGAGEVTPSRASSALWKVAQRKAIDHRRASVREKEELSGLACDLPEQEAPPPPDSRQLLGDMLTTPDDPVGAKLRVLMREVFARGYAGMRKLRKGAAIPPMIRFVDILDGGTWASNSEMGRQCGMEERSFAQRHLQPMLNLFFSSIPASLHEEVTRELCRRGCALDRAQLWAEGQLP